jgi:hypothetical protein
LGKRLKSDVTISHPKQLNYQLTNWINFAVTEELPSKKKGSSEYVMMTKIDAELP